MIPLKYKIECRCGQCNKELITGYGGFRNVINSIKHGVLRSVPYPYFGFLIQRVVDRLRGGVSGLPKHERKSKVCYNDIANKKKEKL
jgi:hypothetical protein